MLHSGRVAALQGQQAADEVVTFQEVAAYGDVVVHAEHVGRLDIGQVFKDLQVLRIFARVREDVGRMRWIHQRVAFVLDNARVAEIEQEGAQRPPILQYSSIKTRVSFISFESMRNEWIS